MPPVRVGFVGFGEVATVFSRTVRENGADVLAYDIKLPHLDESPVLKERMRTAGVELRPLSEVIRNADYVLSTVTPQRAESAARMCAAHLRAGQMYVDLNSTAPAVQVAVRRIVERTGAEFVEGVILGAVGATGAATPVLTGGGQGGRAADILTRLGLSVSHYSPEIGKASEFKMIRSIFSKGLEALLLEMMIAAKKTGIEKDLWQDVVVEFMSRNPFERVAANWVETHPAACARRHYEMEQVVATMRAAGVEPVMTSGTEAFFRRSCSLALAEAFSEKPKSVAAVVDFMERKLSAKCGEGRRPTGKVNA